jgi:MFS family permease
MLLLFFERIPPQQRVGILTVYNLANSVAMAGGALLGAAVMYAWGGGRTAYFVVFVLSSVARAVTLVLLPRESATPAEVPAVHTRVLAVRPNLGTLERPILPPSLEPAAGARVQPAPRQVAVSPAETGSDPAPVPAQVLCRTDVPAAVPYTESFAEHCQ